ncbi:ABC transporter permease [bacterium]|nr:ABC transporter permease [bacterium]
MAPSISSEWSRVRALALLAKITCLDFVRRKDLYVVSILMALFVIAAVAIRIIGIEGPDTARFLMSAGLGLSHAMAAILATVLASRVFPEEFEQRTLMPLLAKPVTRAQVLAGKLAACLTLGGGSLLLFIAANLLAIGMTPGQDISALIQAVGLLLLNFALLSTVAVYLSLFLPALAAGVIAGAWYFGAGFLVRFLKEIAANSEFSGSAIFAKILALAPNPSLLSHVENFTSGGAPLSAGLFGALFLYGLAWTFAFYLLAVWRFDRMKL